MPVENVKGHRVASRQCREGRDEDPELSPGTFHSQRKKEAAKANKKEVMK